MYPNIGVTYAALSHLMTAIDLHCQDEISFENKDVRMLGSLRGYDLAFHSKIYDLLQNHGNS